MFLDSVGRSKEPKFDQSVSVHAFYIYSTLGCLFYTIDSFSAIHAFSMSGSNIGSVVLEAHVLVYACGHIATLPSD